MKKVLKRAGNISLFAWVVLANATNAFAVRTFGDMGKQIGDQASGIAFGLKMVGLVLGLGLGVAGVMNVLQAQKSGQPKGQGIGMIVAGVVLVSITSFFLVASESIFGSSSTAEESLREMGL